MRKFCKKAIIALLSATLIFILTGCGSQQTAAPKEQPKSIQTEKTPEAPKPAETTTPTATPTTTPGTPEVEEENCEC